METPLVSVVRAFHGGMIPIRVIILASRGQFFNLAKEKNRAGPPEQDRCATAGRNTENIPFDVECNGNAGRSSRVDEWPGGLSSAQKRLAD
jgi:hypothetical protein